VYCGKPDAGRTGWAQRGRDYPYPVERKPFRGSHLPIINHQSSFINRWGFTLIELLVVIAVIAVLLAIFIPVTRAARECGQRAVCLSNLRQLTMAWIAYADDHNGKLACASPYTVATARSRRLEGWMGTAFQLPDSRSAMMENPDKGSLWRYIQDVDVYRCPRGPAGHAATYTIVIGANGGEVEGTYLPASTGYELTLFGKRIGNTVLRLTRLTDIVSPGGGCRAVFIDWGYTPVIDFFVHYLYPKWERSAPPIHHAGGATLSMADGHAEYWKWKGRETVTDLPRELMPVGRGLFLEELQRGGYEPQTDDGLYDLQRMQRATWGRLGYPVEKDP
jgi:prepilin-type N-terminal cleavage/methylation domain-containing protein/prepilin-type processing-associated H-X9-DG protein